jgi:signal transduction histidine kinase
MHGEQRSGLSPAPAMTATPAAAAALSTVPVERAERRLALAVVIASTLVFLAVVPSARAKLTEIWGFIPIYQAAVVVIDLVTAVLLFGQFGASRSRALYVLAIGYLFTAFMAVAHALSFPGLFAPGGVIGGGGQTTAWLYFLWHGTFPLFVLGYVALRDEAPAPGAMRPGAAAVLAGMGAALAAAFSFALLTTAGHDALPVIMSGNGDLPAKYVAAWGTCLLCAGVLLALWRRKPHSMLDLWLMVVLFVCICEVALSAVFNAGRFSLGFYAGRVYGLFATSFVLVVLLVENSRLHARLFEAQQAERQLAQAMLARQAERLRILHDIDRAIVNQEGPQAIADAAIRPLRELLGVARAIVNLFNLESGEVEWLAASGRRRTHSGPGVRYSIRLMGDLDALKRGEPQVIYTRALQPGPEIDALLASGVEVYMVMPMIAGGELIGALSFGGERPDFPEEQVRIAREAATQLAVAISQARLLDTVRRHADELEARVRERTRELQAANEELEAFSYSVSHDLRSPLRAIDGYSQILEEDYAFGLDAEGKRLIAVVRTNSAHMAHLIEDLLRFSQFGRMPLAVAPLDMKALALEVVGELAPRYPATRIEVGSLPRAEADRPLLRQVWTNLIGNALKYSARADSPRVEIGGHEEGGENVFWVRDNGAGFDMRYKERLFKVFQRLHRAEEFEGTGVGLAIVQRVVSRHGGRIWAESTVGEGAVFRFAFPAPA